MSNNKHDFLSKHYMLFRATGEMKSYDTKSKCCFEGCNDRLSNKIVSNVMTISNVKPNGAQPLHEYPYWNLLNCKE